MNTQGHPTVKSYGALAEQYDASRYVGRDNETKERLRREGLLSLLPQTARRALDVACGTGRGVAILNHVAALTCGVDGTREMLAMARTKLQAAGAEPRLLQTNAAALPFAEGVFDLVTCLNFVHLFPDVAVKRAFVEEMARVTRPGGLVIVEFDSAAQGLVLGAARKYLGKDIGYDWPWAIRATFPRRLFDIEQVHGVLLPGSWRVPNAPVLHRIVRHAPFNYLATRVFVQARRR